MKSLIVVALSLGLSSHALAQGRISVRPASAPAPRAAKIVDPSTLTSEAPVQRSSLVAMNPGRGTRAKNLRSRSAKSAPRLATQAKRPLMIAATSVTESAPDVAKAPTERRAAAPQRDFTALVSVGLDMRGERDQQQSTIPRSWPTLTLGLGVKPWMGLLEYASFSENSGNNALNVQRKVETLLLWGHWAPDEEWVVQPYMGIGFGGYRTSAEMTLYSERTGSQGKWIEHGAGALGLRLAQLSPFLLAVEGRVHMNRELDPSPTLSGMLKIGFILE